MLLLYKVGLQSGPAARFLLGLTLLLLWDVMGRMHTSEYCYGLTVTIDRV